MICKKCGKENMEGAKFCGFCGNLIIENEVTSPLDLDVSVEQKENELSSQIPFQLNKVDSNNEESFQGNVVEMPDQKSPKSSK